MIKDLLEVIGHEIDMTGFCDRDYTVWEQKVATPLLKAKGFEVKYWFTGEQDSFGPLSRGVVVEKDGNTDQLIYG